MYSNDETSKGCKMQINSAALPQKYHNNNYAVQHTGYLYDYAYLYVYV